MSSTLALALDLGSTTIKAARLDGGGLLDARGVAAPPLRGAPPTREGDALAYVEAAERLLDELGRGLAPGTPIGIASQRSTFLLWDARTGRPASALISWQDARAADWCARHADLESRVHAVTGLKLSAHYAGPKLAAMLERDADLGRRLRDGRLLWGNLDAFLLHRLTGGALHETDTTMAARTALLDLDRGAWSAELLERYGVPASILPGVRPTPCAVELRSGLVVAATVADQAAAALAVLEEGAGDALVSLGTGAFVLRETQGAVRRDGYLTAPIVDWGHSPWRYVLEGAISGSGPAVDACGRGPTELPEHDPTPEAFCLPDAAGLGSPFWRPELRLTFSARAKPLTSAERRRVVLEGLLFRVRQLLDDLAGPAPPRRVFVAGGLAREPFVGSGLAALLGREIELLDEPEGVLTGAARLAAGLAPWARPRTRRVLPAPAGSYLDAKFEAWRDWLAGLL